MSTSEGKTKGKKGKGKGLPKLKTILANPKKERCPALDENELHNLASLLNNSIKTSGLNPQSFATATHIHIGLESSLRAINNSKCSCVLLSHSIQPIFLIRLIARNVEAKNERVPVYVQTKLEDFTKEIFGVRALALALPSVDEINKVKTVDTELIKWVMARSKSAKPKSIRVIPKLLKNKKTTHVKAEVFSNVNHNISLSVQENLPKQFVDDFIAFSDDKVVDKADSEEDDQQLKEALSKIVEKVEAVSAEAMKSQDKFIKKSTAKDTQMEQDDTNEQKCIDMNSSDSDDFLPETYEPLIVHKIQPNPNKKPKKKRPKKNKQNKK